MCGTQVKSALGFVLNLNQMHFIVLSIIIYQQELIFFHDVRKGLPDSTEGIPETNGNSDKNPWGVVVDRKRERMGVWVIVVIALTSAIALVACLGCFWLLFLNFRYHEVKALPSQGEPIFVRTKRSGINIVNSRLKANVK